ncbi:MAG TPA: alpha/beta hydrolase [Streptosporangiaceae bacterium]|nr:alpha/beta hydrolase [Streptosporangiaceae bacterium]
METTKSADGTVIAYDRTGDGPPLIVAVGAFCDRRSFVPPPGLTERFTVYTYDRRGRGDSGDTQPYSPDREVADLAALVSVADSGSGVFAFGHSSGGALVLRAAAQGVPLTAVASYEAPFIVPGSREVAADPAGRIREMVAAGRRGDAVRYWMTTVVAAPPQVLTMMEGSPAWPALEALTHTLPYDIALTGDQGVPASLSEIAVPVLVLGGGTSPDWFHRTVRETAAVIPGAKLVMMEGYDHGVPPEVIAPVLTDFFLGLAG